VRVPRRSQLLVCAPRAATAPRSCPTRRSSDLRQPLLRYRDGAGDRDVAEREQRFGIALPLRPGELRQRQPGQFARPEGQGDSKPDRKSTRLNSSHVSISYAVFCLKKKKRKTSR